MKDLKLYMLLVFASIFTFYSCEEDIEAQDTNYVTFGKSSYSALVDPGSNTTLEIPVFTANIANNERTFSLDINGTSAAAGTFDVPSSVSIPSGSNEGKITIQLTDPGIAQNSIIIKLIPERDLSVGPSTRVNYTQSCTEVPVTLTFNFDFYSSETSWQILDSNGDTVISGGDYSDDQGTATENFNLCLGRSYTLVVTDAFGDGMNDGTNIGSYTLSVNGNIVVQENGNFGASKSSAFSTN